MAEISVGQAVGAGFRILRREPLAVAGWAALYLVVGVAAMALLGGMFAQFFAVLATGDGRQPEMADLMALQMQMMALQPLITLGALVLQTVMMGAIFRAVLEPEARCWAYLRLSGQELWLGLVSIVMSFAIGFGAMVLLFPVVGIAAFVGLAFRESLGPWGMALFGLPAALALVAVVIWVTLRLCMAYPMSFADRNFRLFESWGATRGQAGRLFLVFLAVVLVAVAIQLVGLLIGAGVVAATLGASWRSLSTIDPALLFRAGGALIALLVALGSGLSALTSVITTAPLADAYRQLRASSDA